MSRPRVLTEPCRVMIAWRRNGDHHLCGKPARPGVIPMCSRHRRWFLRNIARARLAQVRL